MWCNCGAMNRCTKDIILQEIFFPSEKEGKFLF